MKYGIFVLTMGMILVSIEKVGFGGGLRSLIERLSIPFIQSSGRFSAFTHAPFVFFDATQRAEQENLELREQRAELLSMLGGVTLNKTLATEKKLTTDRNDAHFIQTTLIGSDQPMIPVGSFQGIREGAMVMSHNALIGIVTRVGVQFSQVELVSQLARKMSVRVRELETEGLLQQENGEVVLTHVRPDAKLAVGQTITTFGNADGVLPYTPIAKVKELFGTPSDPFQRAHIELLIIPRDGIAVSVLQNGEAQ